MIGDDIKQFFINENFITSFFSVSANEPLKLLGK
jgi:hypothetical protein